MPHRQKFNNFQSVRFLFLYLVGISKLVNELLRLENFDCLLCNPAHEYLYLAVIQ